MTGLAPSPLALAADLLDPRRPAELDQLERDWRGWLMRVMPGSVTAPFAEHHEQFWDWVWDIRPGVRPRPFVGIWSRGAAKSTSAEGGCVSLGARRRRRYGLYISGTQLQGDQHVQNVATLLESDRIAQLYPAMGQRRVGKYGSSRGWRRNRLATASGFTLDALGLDSAVRGLKFDDQRPDLMVIDDIDDEFDGPAQIARKIKLLTEAILPAGSDDLAVLAIQNLIHRNGIFARLAAVADEPADFLADRILSGPIPAVRHLETVADTQADGSTRTVIVRGEPTWAGMGLEVCQQIIDTEGITAFRTERQHDAEPPSGGLWREDFPFQRCDPDQVPDLITTVVWVDPAVTDTDRSDSHGIQVDGVAETGVIYRLWSWEHRTSPEDSLKRAIRLALTYGGEAVGVETDQGGDTWSSVFRAARDQVQAELEQTGEPIPGRWPAYRYEKAGAGHGPKVARAQQMLADYERPGRIIHVRGSHEILERALRRFPRTKPFDLVDCSFWSWRDLNRRRGHKARLSGRQVARGRIYEGINR